MYQSVLGDKNKSPTAELPEARRDRFMMPIWSPLYDANLLTDNKLRGLLRKLFEIGEVSAAKAKTVSKLAFG